MWDILGPEINDFNIFQTSNFYNSGGSLFFVPMIC